METSREVLFLVHKVLEPSNLSGRWFFLLAYIKFLSVSFTLLFPAVILDMMQWRIRPPTYLYYAGTVQFMGSEHCPYALLACNSEPDSFHSSPSSPALSLPTALLPTLPQSLQLHLPDTPRLHGQLPGLVQEQNKFSARLPLFRWREPHSHVPIAGLPDALSPVLGHVSHPVSVPCHILDLSPVSRRKSQQPTHFVGLTRHDFLRRHHALRSAVHSGLGVTWNSV